MFAFQNMAIVTNSDGVVFDRKVTMRWNFCNCHSWGVIISADGHESYLWSQFEIETFPIADDIVIGLRYNALDPTFHQLAVLLIIRVRSEKETPQGSQHEDGQKDEDDGSGIVQQLQTGSPTDQK